MCDSVERINVSDLYDFCMNYDIFKIFIPSSYLILQTFSWHLISWKCDSVFLWCEQRLSYFSCRVRGIWVVKVLVSFVSIANIRHLISIFEFHHWVSILQLKNLCQILNKRTAKNLWFLMKLLFYDTGQFRLQGKSNIAQLFLFLLMVSRHYFHTQQENI